MAFAKEFLEKSMQNKLLKVGIAGTVIAALCCFTPILVILFGIIGLSTFVGYLDYVLLPTLLAFILLTIYALWKRNIQ
ncbi:mercury resistance system transport protein MerF [Kiloniella laminariae]|uniref:Mercury resistance system transport protein MerF n=1 Tax=Kiloniella laminariae TaxID=454162 RepID=A0ABT4LN80_9PROT|nr:mercury resistance system transport protein MerF [Kiloniella laminariae]MCZ4282542.1 mercury resistance system transport protein MerF [Kiloniella laminariae]